jgi:L-amino acid N-acyltransferase YncA
MILEKADKKAIGLFTQYLFNPVAFFLSKPQLEYPYNEDDWKKYFSEHATLYVGVIEKKQVVYFALSTNGRKKFLLTHLFVPPIYRKNSFSKKALRKFIEEFDFTEVQVELECNQREIIKLFNDLNFTNINETHSYLFETKEYKFSKWILSK